MSKKTNNLYAFGDFKLDAGERVLYRSEQLLTLPPKVFDTLLVLVESSGKILSKEELMNEIWQDSFVEEGNLSQNIYALRKIFSKRNNFIETVPRRGYRFTADVRMIEPENGFEIERANDFSEIIVSRKRTTTLLHEQIIEEDVDDFEEISPTKSLAGERAKPFFQSKKFRLGLAAGVLPTVLIAVIGFFVWQTNFAAPANALLENISFTNLTETGDVRSIAISPDGQFLAFIQSDSKTIRLKDINSRQSLPLDLAGEFNPQAICFSPDGNSIYFLNRKNAVSGAEIYKTTRFGGNTEFIAGDVWSDFEISPDGNKIAFFRKLSKANEHQLIKRNLTDKSEHILSVKHFPEGFELRSSPAFSPDTRDIYAIAKPQANPVSRLVKINVESGAEERIVAPKIRQFVSLTASPDGENLIFTAREKNKFPQIYKMNKAGGEIQKLSNDLNIYRKLSISADGKNLAAVQKNTFSHIWILPNADAAQARQLTFGKNNRDGKHGLDVLPDGKIVFTSLEDMNRDLWILNPNDNSKQQLTVKSNEANERPIAAADGNFIYFSALKGETYHIKKIQPNGQNLRQITDDDGGNDLFPNISADGATLYFIRKTKGKSVIIRKNTASGEETKINLPAGFAPDSFLALSPDENFLAFRQADIEKRTDLEEETSNLIKIGIISLDGDPQKAKIIAINTSQSQFRWNNSSDAIYFINHTPENSVILKQNIFEDSEPPEVIVELKDTKIYHFQFFNENDLVVSQGKHIDDAVLIRNID